MIIKWTNKFSNETGYVEELNGAERHFINTFNKNDAMKYSCRKNAMRAIKRLIGYGEGVNNIFEIETV